MKNRFNSLILTLYTVLAAAFLLFSCTPYSQEFSRQHGIDGSTADRNETRTAVRIARKYLETVTAGRQFVLTDISGMANRCFIDTTPQDLELLSDCLAHLEQSVEKPWLYDSSEIAELRETVGRIESSPNPDTVRYRVMWFRVRIDSGDGGICLEEFALYFTPGLDFWSLSEQETVARIRQSR